MGQGDAGIGFNSAHSFDFNPDDGITAGSLDFDAVVVHEIGHALGFTSNPATALRHPSRCGISLDFARALQAWARWLQLHE